MSYANITATLPANTEARKESLDNGVLNDIDAVLSARHQLRQAIIETIEAGDPETQKGWGCFHPFGCVADDSQERFADAVIQRLGS